MSAAKPRPVKCLVADDHPAMRRAITEILVASGIDVIGEASDGEEALEKIETRKPDVALVDIRMPRLSGIEVARRALALDAGDRGLLYSGYGDNALLHRGARRRRARLRPQGGAARRPHRAIETVAEGGTYVDPVLAGSSRPRR